MNDSSIPLPIPRRTMSWKLFFVYVLLAAILLTILNSSLAATIIRNIDNIFLSLSEDDYTMGLFAEVFAALDHAVLEVHALIPSILALVFSFGVGMILRTGRKHGGVRFVVSIVLAVLVGLLLFVVSLAVSILLTEVNDIRFSDLAFSLAENLDALAGLL